MSTNSHNLVVYKQKTDEAAINKCQDKPSDAISKKYAKQHLLENKKQCIQTIYSDIFCSVALYGYETWTITTSKSDKINLESFEIWCYGAQKSWMEKKANEEGLVIVGEQRKKSIHIEKKKSNDGKKILNIIRKVEGKNRKGDPVYKLKTNN